MQLQPRGGAGGLATSVNPKLNLNALAFMIMRGLIPSAFDCAGQRRLLHTYYRHTFVAVRTRVPQYFQRSVGTSYRGSVSLCSAFCGNQSPGITQSSGLRIATCAYRAKIAKRGMLVKFSDPSCTIQACHSVRVPALPTIGVTTPVEMPGWSSYMTLSQKGTPMLETVIAASGLTCYNTIYQKNTYLCPRV